MYASAPDVACLEQPVVNDTELVVIWSYVHTGGLNITSTVVEYHNDSSDVFKPLPSSPSNTSGSGSLQSSGTGEEALTSTNSTSLPLPLAGVTYFFRVTATNEQGSTTAECPSILMTTGSVAHKTP